MPFLGKEGVAMDVLNEKTCGYCKSCDSTFEYQPGDMWFDEHGLGYSTRLTHCKNCGKIVVLETIEDYGLDVNSDKRFYV